MRARVEEDEGNAAAAGQAVQERIREIVRQVPPGRVATYGQVAFVAGVSTARLVGRVMAELPAGSDVPWHRVLNSQGRISRRRDGGGSPEQQRRLRREGVFLDRTGRVDFAAAAWAGPSWAWLEANGFDLEELVLRSAALRRHGAWVNWGL